MAEPLVTIARPPATRAVRHSGLTDRAVDNGVNDTGGSTSGSRVDVPACRTRALRQRAGGRLERLPAEAGVRPFPRDIFSDIMLVELEAEVEDWIVGLHEERYAHVLVQVDRLERMGSTIREPWSKTLGDGLCELRFDLERVAWRISYFFGPNRRVILLTVFRKQRSNERHEVRRAAPFFQ